MTSSTVALPCDSAITSSVSAATITPMQATVRPVCACVTSSTTASRNTAALAPKALRSVMALDGSGQTTGPPFARSSRSSSLRKHSQK